MNPTITNRQAKFQYEILDRYTAGIQLTGTEVKALRQGKASLGECYAYVSSRGEIWVKNMHIAEYSHGAYGNHLPLRERKLLLKKGEIEKTVHSRSHIEYELINLYESVNTQLKNLHNEINSIFEEIRKFQQTSKEENFSYHERLRNTIHLIHIIQSVESIMKLLSYYPTFKKDRMFSQINRKINDCWEVIMNNIMHQPEEDFLNEIINNLQIGRKNQNNIN